MKLAGGRLDGIVFDKAVFLEVFFGEDIDILFQESQLLKSSLQLNLGVAELGQHGIELSLDLGGGR